MTGDNYKKQSITLSQKLKEFGLNQQVLYKICEMFEQKKQDYREGLEECKGLFFYNPEKTESRMQDFERTLRDQHLRVLGGIYSFLKDGKSLDKSLEDNRVEKKIRDCLVKMI